MSHNNLVEIDADGQATPELAETWEVSPDAKKWVFKLRKGIEFHNGKALDSKDVVASIKYHSKGSGGARVIVDQIKKISADGKHTVIFKLKEGNADFAFLLSDLRLVIAPAGTKGKAWQKAIGTGAYVLREWNGVRVFATRNPNYWKEGRGHFDEVEMFVISDQMASSNALRAGQVDVVQGVDLKTVDLLKQTPGIQVVEVSGSSHVTFPMRTDKPPFDNNDVRLALKHAIDREALIKSIKHGHA
ncbi:MAG: ABC transporter substrate-binding protein, partial [Alphaproteobacteria bacterium]|nr:ABC transporter substrate-binding protein [Alphaproteobacteria bacterium]